MKKTVFTVTFLLLIFFAVSAFAAPYTDTENQYTVELPDSAANVYYYTKQSSNMPDELLTIAQTKTPAALFMVASYADGRTLSYSVDMTAAALTDALGDPAVSAADMTALTDAQRLLLSQNKKTEYGADYTFDADVSGTVGGKPAQVLTGRLSGSNTETRIYQTVDSGKLFTVTLLYQTGETSAAADAESVLSTLHFADAPAAAAVSQKTSASPSVSPSPTAEPTAEPPASASPSGFFENLRARITDAYHSDPLFPVYVAGACVVAALLIIIIVLIAANRRKDKQLAAEENLRQQEAAAEDAPLAETSDSPEQPDAEPFARPTIAQQALGSRETVPRKIAEEPQAETAGTISENSPEESPADPSRPKVGSRVERYTKKKK